MRAPTFKEERALLAQGYSCIAGVDEVGRGPLAGPVMAAAVVLPPRLKAPWVKQVRDSKLLTPKRRETLCRHIEESGIANAVGLVSSEEIDRIGIAPATRLAMQQAVSKLTQTPDFLLIDALKLPAVKLPQKAVVDGDSLCLSIACASIVAKVTRDHLMEEMDALYQGYGFAANKGYGTAEHLAALGRLGPCPIHRRSFAPVREI